MGAIYKYNNQIRINILRKIKLAKTKPPCVSVTGRLQKKS